MNEFFKTSGTSEIDPKKAGKIVAIVAVIIAALIVARNCFYNVGEQEQAVVTTFGKVQSVQTAGLYFKLPFISQVTKVDTTTRGMQIGYVENASTPVILVGVTEITLLLGAFVPDEAGQVSPLPLVRLIPIAVLVVTVVSVLTKSWKRTDPEWREYSGDEFVSGNPDV